MRTRTPWGGARSLAVLAETARAAAGLRPDCVVVGHAVMLPAFAAARRGAPAALLAYGSELWNTRTAFAVRRLQGTVRSFVAISHFTGAQLRQLGVPGRSIAVVPLGADAPAAPTDARERLERLGLVDEEGIRPFLVTVARLAEPHKGHDVVLRALPALAARHPRLNYVVAGDGPLRAHLERLAETAGASHARFTGRVDEPTKAALLAECRAFVMVSREARAAAQFEGFGLVYAEAARAGRPSIAGRAGAAPEVVLDETTGLLVRPDDPVEVVGAALRLLDDPGLAHRLGVAARTRADLLYTWDAAGERLVTAVEALLA
jgi:phosphatidyl-myo-inositol dimannoside synthase